MIGHTWSTCACVRCRVRRALIVDAAFREEMAGRGAVFAEARPRPGTMKALQRAYGPKRKRKAS